MALGFVSPSETKAAPSLKQRCGRICEQYFEQLLTEMGGRPYYKTGLDAAVRFLYKRSDKYPLHLVFNIHLMSLIKTIGSVCGTNWLLLPFPFIGLKKKGH